MTTPLEDRDGLAPTASPRLRRIAVVLNGSAGTLLADPGAAAALTEQFAEAGLTPVFVPQDEGSLPDRLARACGMQADAVVVAGGDGSVACAAKHLLGSGVPLGILPFGTMNLLAKDLGIPVGDTQAAIALLAEGVPRAIDVGMVGDEVFLCASMLGLPARLARHRERGRHGNRLLGWARFALAALRSLLRVDRVRLDLRTEAGARWVVTQSLTVTVNPLGLDTGHTFGRPVLDGGELGIYIVERVRLRDLPRLAWHAIQGRAQADPTIQASRAHLLDVGSGRRVLRVMNDGEVRLLPTPLHYRLLPRALVVMAPPAGGGA